MTAIKSYTDLPQSKKLAKILPLESADMFYHYNVGINSYYEDFPRVIQVNNHFAFFHHDVPCWSLAALIEEIPEIINFEDDENDYALEILKESGLYYLSYGNPLENDKLEIEAQENFVDACYELVLKLNELNLLRL